MRSDTMHLYENKLVFSGNHFKRGMVIEVSGYDEEGDDISGTYMVKSVTDDELDLYGFAHKSRQFIQPTINVDDLEEHRVNIAFYSKLEVEKPLLNWGIDELDKI